MKVKLLSNTAKKPTRGSYQSAGFDLYANENTAVLGGQRRIISTGIAVQAPDGCYLRVAPRSGLAAKHGIDILAGVIDADYTGEIKVIMQNNDGEPFDIHVGDRIAQLIPEKIWVGEIELVSVLAETYRGDGAMGSTGK